jgi:hypothetical protein
MVDGFQLGGSRASLIVDLIAIALVALVPALFIGAGFAKRGRYLVHRRLQSSVVAILFAAVAAFEWEMRFYGWRDRAIASPYYPVVVNRLLAFHLAFSVTTAIVLVATLILALVSFPNPPAPNAHSRVHRSLGWAAVFGLAGTAATGWVFYYAAFVAR